MRKIRTFCCAALFLLASLPVPAAQLPDRRIVGCHCRCHFVGSRLLAGFLRTGTDQGYHSGGDAAGVCFRTGVRSAYYLVVCIAFHQQISENEGKHPVLHITLLSEKQSFR